MRGPQAAGALQEALRDPDDWVRYFAAGALANHGAAGTEALLETVERETAPHVRIAALRSLGLLRATGVAPLAERFTHDADDDLATAALEALALVTDSGADDRLRDAVHGTREPLRLAAVALLGSRGTKAAVATLTAAARLPVQPALDAAAVEALGRMAAQASDEVAAVAVEALLELGLSPECRDAVVKTIASLPSPCVRWLQKALTSSQVAVRRLAVDGAARMRDPRASATLLTALTDDEPSVRATALDAVSRLAPLSAAQAVMSLRDADPDPGVRRRAHAVCVRHGWTGASFRSPRGG
jgi:HEAT repeat protein